MHRAVLCLAVLAAGAVVAPRQANAAVTDFYSTIDFVEVLKRDPANSNNPSLVVRGVLVGTTAIVTRTYVFVPTTGVHLEGLHTAFYCQQLATTVMLNPGQLQFAIGATPSNGQGGCRVTAI